MNDLLFQAGERVRATLGPTTIVGEVSAYTHHGQPLLTIHPDGLETHPFSTMDVWADDGWVVEHLTEVP